MLPSMHWSLRLLAVVMALTVGGFLVWHAWVTPSDPQAPAPGPAAAAPVPAVSPPAPTPAPAPAAAAPAVEPQKPDGGNGSIERLLRGNPGPSREYMGGSKSALGGLRGDDFGAGSQQANPAPPQQQQNAAPNR